MTVTTGYRWKQDNIAIALSFPVAILGLLTVIRALDILDFVFFQTTYRLTTAQFFHIPLLGSYLIDDLLIVSVGLTAFAAFFLHTSKKLVVGVAGFYSILAALAVFSEEVVVADVLALSMMPVLVAVWVITSRSRSNVSQWGVSRNSVIISLAILFAIIEVASLVTWLAYPISTTKIYSDWQWYAASSETQLFYAFGSLSTILMILAAFSVGIKPASDTILLWIQKSRKSLNQIDTDQKIGPSSIQANRISTIIFLSLSVGLVITIGAYPYLPSINPNFQQVSVDVPFYINQINFIQENGFFAEGGPFDTANDRALSLVVFYAFVAVSNQPASQIVPFIPIPLGILMAFSIYFLTRYVFGKYSYIPLIASLLTAVSSQIIVGIYAGFLSNMLALSVSFIVMLLFLRYQNRRKKLDLALFGTAFIILLPIHVYTWIFLAGTILIATAIMIYTNARGASKWNYVKMHIPVIGIVIGTGIAVLIVASIRDTSGLQHISNFMSTNLGPDFFAKRWFNINYTFRAYLGGFLTNSVMIAIALIWSLKADYKNKFNVLIVSSMSIASFFFFLGDTVAQSRILYDIPLQIPAAIIIGQILTGQLFPRIGTRGRLVIVAAIVLHFVNYAFRSASNLVLPQ